MHAIPRNLHGIKLPMQRVYLHNVAMLCLDAQLKHLSFLESLLYMYIADTLILLNERVVLSDVCECSSNVFMHLHVYINYCVIWEVVFSTCGTVDYSRNRDKRVHG